MLGDRAEQTFVVRVAADDTVQDDDVRRLDRPGLDGDVLQAPLRTPFEAALTQQLRSHDVVTRRELEVHRSRGAALEQLDLDLSDSAADLEHGRTFEAARLEERDHSPRRPVEAALA